NVLPASASACLTTGTIARKCSREASSGTTPPYGLCVAICEATTLEIICSPERTTAAAVSSQELSIPRMKVSAIGVYDNQASAADSAAGSKVSRFQSFHKSGTRESYCKLA